MALETRVESARSWWIRKNIPYHFPSSSSPSPVLSELSVHSRMKKHKKVQACSLMLLLLVEGGKFKLICTGFYGFSVCVRASSHHKFIHPWPAYHRLVSSRSNDDDDDRLQQ